MTSAPLGVAVIGTGFGQKVHIPGLQAHHRTEVVAVYHRDRDKAAAIAAAHQIPHSSDSLAEILALPTVAAVTLATPPFTHGPMATAILQAGKHLLLEKPTALSRAEAAAIQTLAQQQQRIVTLDFEFRFVPAWQQFAQLLRDGFVGKPRLIQVDWTVPGRADPRRPWSWYAVQAQGGGALGAFGSHTFDYLTWLFGPVKQLCAHLSTAIPQRPDPATGELRPVDADDTALILLEMADGTPAQVAISSVTHGGRGHWLTVHGDRATLSLGSANLQDYVHGFQLQAAPAGQPWQSIPLDSRWDFPQTYSDGRLAPFIRVVDHWVQNIDQGQATAPSIVEGVRSQALMDLAHQSHRQRTWVTVPPLG